MGDLYLIINSGCKMQRQTNTRRCNLQLSTERKTSKLVPSEQLAQQRGRGWRQSSGLQKEQSMRLGEIKEGSPRVSNLDHHCLFDLILWFLNDQLSTRSPVYLHQHSTVPHITLYSLSPAPRVALLPILASTWYLSFQAKDKKHPVTGHPVPLHSTLPLHNCWPHISRFPVDPHL